MNFKFTQTKVISSVIFFLIIDFVLSYKILCLQKPGLINGICQFWAQQMISLGFLFFSLVLTAIFYIIWSLAESGKK